MESSEITRPLARAGAQPPIADGQLQEPLPWHAADLQEVLQRLGVTDAGLTSSTAQHRLEQYGPNALPEPRRRSLLAIILAQLRSPLIYLLLAAAAVSLWLQEFDDATFIVLVLIINTTIGAVQEWRAAGVGRAEAVAGGDEHRSLALSHQGYSTRASRRHRTTRGRDRTRAR